MQKFLRPRVVPYRPVNKLATALAYYGYDRVFVCPRAKAVLDAEKTIDDIYRFSAWQSLGDSLAAAFRKAGFEICLNSDMSEVIVCEAFEIPGQTPRLSPAQVQVVAGIRESVGQRLEDRKKGILYSLNLSRTAKGIARKYTRLTPRLAFDRNLNLEEMDRLVLLAFRANPHTLLDVYPLVR